MRATTHRQGGHQGDETGCRNPGGLASDKAPHQWNICTLVD
jgi:hypothetical protein